jgi:hypothetical protein
MEGMEPFVCLVYEKYVIYRVPTYCYYRAVHRLEYSIPAMSGSTLFDEPCREVRHGADRYANCKGAHRVISQRKSSHWRSP